MIYLFLGEYRKASKKASALVEVLVKKQPDATVLKFNDENFIEENIGDLIKAQGLFFSKNIIVLSKIMTKEENKEVMFENISDIKASDNIFIFIEESLDKKSLAKFEKNAEKIQKIENQKPKEVEKFNPFKLADAVGSKDKKNAWLLYLEALKKSRPEEIYGILWWQMKTLLIVKNSQSPKETGLSPFVLNKNKSFLKNFSGDEIEKKSFELIKIYHDSRRQNFSLEIGLEKWLLSWR